MSEKRTIRIEKSLLDKVRERFPELSDVSDSDIARIGLRKLLEVTKSEH